ncbi:hypothetical protein [Jeotgalibacillus soli]|uniref:Uncharacterized protein n=1 Tax=Jeotgalibacillus soli TaxID=889306 RepID=A0A0C2W7W5_9BACL|nr:hypothetical protein [Jeotgalibacillus soli]KIL52113.1 hypothetical protein KP78_04830 [Jeotgalibacillus soli]
MDQLLRRTSIIAMILFGLMGLLFWFYYGEWSFKAMTGFGAALALFLLTIQPPKDEKQNRTS